MAPHVLPSAGYLHECLVYDPERGTLKWRKTRPAEHFANITLQRNWMTRHAGRNAYAGMGEPLAINGPGSTVSIISPTALYTK